ncbi:MAG: host attachment protein, partial [Alphaproteobacteria bacterium]|nr:host attachment protein [Alphaproteobacteria bacterium]
TGDGFRDLVLVAPPHFLGDLRGALSGVVAGKVNATVAKELTDVPDHALSERLRAALADQPLIPEG